MNKKAFTLIELLVVVLIIGILAAIALPQYEKSVVKSRFAEAMTNLKTIVQADEVCRMEKGENSTCKLEELPLEIGAITTPDGRYSSTTYFKYMASDSPDGAPSALYLKEDVCLCYQDGEIRVGQNPNMDCDDGQDPSMDYAKLLNLTESDCYCC